jgi:hypothetical protein
VFEMKFALTFNKPAVANFIDTDVYEGMRVKIEGGQVFFKPTKSARGNGVFAIVTRTRGGTGIEISGKFAEDFLKKTGMERGTHMVLHATSYGWMVAEPVGAPGEKPSKIHPCARLWRSIEEMGEKSEKAPAKAARAPRAKKAAPAKAARTPRKAKAETEAAPKRTRKAKAASTEAAANAA